MRMHPISCWASRLMQQSIQVVLLHLPLSQHLSIKLCQLLLGAYKILCLPACKMCLQIVSVCLQMFAKVSACRTLHLFLSQESQVVDDAILPLKHPFISVVLCSDLLGTNCTICSLSLSGISCCNCHGWQWLERLLTATANDV